MRCEGTHKAPLYGDGVCCVFMDHNRPFMAELDDPGEWSDELGMKFEEAAVSDQASKPASMHAV